MFKITELYNFFKIFFNKDNFLSVYWICYNKESFCFMSWFFGYKACSILAPGPGIKPLSSALEGKVLTIGQPGKSLNFKIVNFMSQ